MGAGETIPGDVDVASGGGSAAAGTTDVDVASSGGTSDMLVSSPLHFLASHSSSRDSVPISLVVPTREHLDSVRRLMSGDTYIGRGCRQRSWGKTLFHNPYKVSECGREYTIKLFEQHLDSSSELLNLLPLASG